jgi:hypothetical protein
MYFLQNIEVSLIMDTEITICSLLFVMDTVLSHGTDS